MSPASFSAGIDSPVSAACWTWRSRASSRRASAGTRSPAASRTMSPGTSSDWRSEEHTSELQSQSNLVCRLLLEIKTELQAQGGGRVTELAARPLLNLFFPELSGLVQPLSVEYAGRRRVLGSVPFFTCYGLELGLVLAISEAYGLRAIAQVDLGMRGHRNQTLFDLSKMAFAIIQVGLKHLGDRHRIHLLEEVNKTMKLIHYEDERY